MHAVTYRFVLARNVSMENVALTWQMAKLAGAGLFSAAQIALDMEFVVDDAARRIEISGPAELANALVRVFVSLLHREIGGRAFKVTRRRGGLEAAEVV